MAAGDFADLQLHLARLAGRPTAADLDDDLELAKQVINEVYLECYAPIDGVRPPWARRPFGFFFSAPTTQTITVTKGSKVFTGYAPSATTAGSLVKVGSNYYTYAGQNGANHEFVEPVIEATGSTSATFYHNSLPMDARIVQVLGNPELFGFGPLSPIADDNELLLHRASFSGDFEPAPGSGGYQSSGLTWGWGGASYEVGFPRHFRADARPFFANSAYAVRFVVYPLPDRDCTGNFMAWFIPARLSANADVPRLPADLTLEVLLPIARYEWAATYKKYAGENIDLLREKAAKARVQLRNLTLVQANQPVRIRPKYL
jgi:hypothetical protein